MKIDYNWKDEPVKKVHGLSGFINWFRHKPVPMHMSNHYHKEHWPDADDPQGKLF